MHPGSLRIEGTPYVLESKLGPLTLKKLPKNVSPYKRTPTFTELSVPPGLLKAHQTKSGTWGSIVIISGELLYRILEPKIEEVSLSPNHFGVVEPQVLHEVQPRGEVEFYVEFYR